MGGGKLLTIVTDTTPMPDSSNTKPMRIRLSPAGLLGAIQRVPLNELIRVLVLVAGLFVAAAGHTQAETTELKNLDKPQDVDRVVIFKSDRELYLYNDGLVINRYPIALGQEPVGTKQRRGDNKTPVGSYTINWRNSESRFHLSLHISYPDADDRAQAQRQGVDPGDNIMIHGQPDYSSRERTGDWTHGCIAVSNQAIDTIWRLVPSGTPIQIYQ